MIFPLGWSVYYREPDALAILYALAVTMVVGGLMTFFLKSRETIRQREGFAIVSLGWIFASLFGSLPYLFSGTFVSFTDAFFETMSGFTTTGASVLTNIEVLPHGILFWRSLTHWLGGMGIMVLFVALLSQLGGGGLQMFKAESPGPVAERIKPRIQETAKALWLTYVILSLLQVILLLFGGMNLFDALCHTFGTMATGGFSTKNLSIGYYPSPYIQWVITIFMFAAGANFALYYQMVKKRTNSFWQNEEFRLYLWITLGSILFICADLALNQPSGLEKTVRDAAFQVVSIITTTGYATVDFEKWPTFSKIILLITMFIGGCSGSTGGAVKVGRILILLKHTFIEILRLIHPRSVKCLKIGDKTVPDAVVINVLQFFFLYLLIFFLGTAVMAAFGLNMIEAFSSVATTLGNVGPGFGLVGPMGNFAAIPEAGKWFLSLFMLLGRLEIFTVLVLFVPEVWKS
ncbi:potassium transporter [Candidatus Formimonas warabiya]|uniref:Potassium transporter n=2 Tax=Formimonas warabiya TaxID=1761012 RepID=A0A3G1L145_FORW1|nr:potassium transporter [Candidatus Formimonas warabiya]